MARKANIDNLIRDAKKIDDRIIEIEKMLETAKSDSASAWDKVSERKKELEQEKNNGLAEVDKDVFWADITPAELRIKWDELLLIAEVKDYIESERAKHKTALESKVGIETVTEEATPDDTTSDNPTL